MAEQQAGAEKNGAGKEDESYEKELAGYLQERIKPGLNSGAIPLLARSIAKEIARRGSDTGQAPDFEADMRELQEELGEDWTLSFSVHGDDGWLTAETQDGSEHVKAETAAELLEAVAKVKDGGDQSS